jgi:hypothetical protein
MTWEQQRPHVTNTRDVASSVHTGPEQQDPGRSRPQVRRRPQKKKDLYELPYRKALNGADRNRRLLDLIEIGAYNAENSVKGRRSPPPFYR